MGLLSALWYTWRVATAKRVSELTRSIKQGVNIRRSQSDTGQNYRIINVRNLSLEGITGDLDLGKFDTDLAQVTSTGNVLLAQAASNLQVLVVESDEPCVVGPNIAALEVKPDLLNPYYLAGLLNTEVSRNRLKRLATGGATTMVPLTELRRFEIPWIALEQQEKYARLFNAAVETRRAASALIKAHEHRITHLAIPLWEDIDVVH